MKKMLFFLSAFVLMGSYGYAQTEGEASTTAMTESSVHASAISDLAKDATETGKAKGFLISSAARAKAMTVANANASFLRGDATPGNANVTANANASATATAKLSTLPPVSAPTTGQPTSTPVGKPIGVPVSVRGAVHVGGH